MDFKKIGGFYITNINNEFFLISDSFKSSIKRDKELQKFLKSINFNGKLYIDTILTTGTAENRYLTAYFNNKITNLTIADLATATKINSISQTFFSKNMNLLDNSHLTERQITIATKVS